MCWNCGGPDHSKNQCLQPDVGFPFRPARDPSNSERGLRVRFNANHADNPGSRSGSEVNTAGSLCGNISNGNNGRTATNYNSGGQLNGNGGANRASGRE